MRAARLLAIPVCTLLLISCLDNGVRGYEKGLERIDEALAIEDLGLAKRALSSLISRYGRRDWRRTGKRAYAFAKASGDWEPLWRSCNLAWKTHDEDKELRALYVFACHKSGRSDEGIKLMRGAQLPDSEFARACLAPGLAAYANANGSAIKPEEWLLLASLAQIPSLSRNAALGLMGKNQAEAREAVMGELMSGGKPPLSLLHALGMYQQCLDIGYPEGAKAGDEEAIITDSLLRCGYRDEALAYLRQSLAQGLDSRLAIMLSQLSPEWTEGRDALLLSLGRRPTNTELIRALASLYARHSLLDQATQVLSTYSPQDEDGDIIKVAIELQRQVPERAEATLITLENKHAQSQRVREYVLAELLHLGRYQAAFTILKRKPGSGKDQASRLATMCFELAQGRQDEAAESFLKLAEDSAADEASLRQLPGAFPWFFNSAMAFALAGRREESDRMLERAYQATEVNTERSWAVYWRGELAAGSGRRADALTLYREALELWPESGQIRAKVHMYQGVEEGKR